MTGFVPTILPNCVRLIVSIYICYMLFRLLESVTCNFTFCLWFVLLNNISADNHIYVFWSRKTRLFLSLLDFVRQPVRLGWNLMAKSTAGWFFLRETLLNSWLIWLIISSNQVPPPPSWVVRLVTAVLVSSGGSFAGSDARNRSSMTSEIVNVPKLTLCLDAHEKLEFFHSLSITSIFRPIHEVVNVGKNNN
jgi:hypothetical protein